MKSSSFKVFMMLVWFLTANHCFISLALASPTLKTETAKHHCCGKEEKENKSSAPHKGCDKVGCCQPVIEAAPNSVNPNLPLEFSIPVFLSNALIENSPLELNLLGSSPHCIGPPDPFISCISSLSVAQNAPPSNS